MDSKFYIENAKKTVNEFIEDLRENIFLNDQEFKKDLTMVETYFELYDGNTFINDLCENLIPYKHKIKNRDVDFFIKNKDKLFSQFDQKKLKKIIKFLKSNIIENSEKEKLWGYFDVLITLSELYIKNCKK